MGEVKLCMTCGEVHRVFHHLDAASRRTALSVKHHRLSWNDPHWVHLVTDKICSEIVEDVPDAKLREVLDEFVHHFVSYVIDWEMADDEDEEEVVRP